MHIYNIVKTVKQVMHKNYSYIIIYEHMQNCHEIYNNHIATLLKYLHTIQL